MRPARRSFTWILWVGWLLPFSAMLIKGNLTAPLPWLLLVGLVTGVIGIIIAIARERSPGTRGTPSAWAITIIAVVTAACALGEYGGRAFEISLFNFAMCLCCYLVLTDQARFGVPAGCIVLLLGIATGIGVTAAPVVYLNLLAYAVAVLLASVTWHRVAHIFARRENQFRASASPAVSRRLESERALVRLRFREGITSSGARQALERIAASDDLSEADRRELRIVENALRDVIRSPYLQDAGFTSEVSAARRRGVAIRLLGAEAGSPFAVPVRGALAHSLSRILVDATPDEQITVRQTVREESPVVTVVVGSASASRRYVYGYDGREIGALPRNEDERPAG